MSVELARRAASGDLDPEVLAWLADGMRRHLAGDTDLPHALGLDRASRLRQRNAALRDAAALVAPGAEPWPAAVRLAAAVRHYEGSTAPLIARDPARELAPLHQALRRAFDAGERVPRTARNLYEVIR